MASLHPKSHRERSTTNAQKENKKDAGDGEDRCHAREGALFARATYTRYVNADVWTSMAAIFPIPYILFVFL